VGASEAPTTFKIYAVDPESNQVGFYGVMKENNRPLIIALRLKVVDGEITEMSTFWRVICALIECRT